MATFTIFSASFYKVFSPVRFCQTLVNMKIQFTRKRFVVHLLYEWSEVALEGGFKRNGTQFSQNNGFWRIDASCRKSGFRYRRVIRKKGRYRHEIVELSERRGIVWSKWKISVANPWPKFPKKNKKWQWLFVFLSGLMAGSFLRDI